MNSQVAFTGQENFPLWTARATLQVRPGDVVAAEPSPALKYLELWNPLNWSVYDLSRFADLAGRLTLLILLIDKFSNGNL